MVFIKLLLQVTVLVALHVANPTVAAAQSGDPGANTNNEQEGSVVRPQLRRLLRDSGSVDDQSNNIVTEENYARNLQATEAPTETFAVTDSPTAGTEVPGTLSPVPTEAPFTFDDASNATFAPTETPAPTEAPGTLPTDGTEVPATLSPTVSSAQDDPTVRNPLNNGGDVAAQLKYLSSNLKRSYSVSRTATDAPTDGSTDGTEAAPTETPAPTEAPGTLPTDGTEVPATSSPTVSSAQDDPTVRDPLDNGGDVDAQLKYLFSNLKRPYSNSLSF